MGVLCGIYILSYLTQLRSTLDPLRKGLQYYLCVEAQNRMHITIGVAGVSPRVSRLNMQLRDNTENEFHGYKLVIVKPV